MDQALQPVHESFRALRPALGSFFFATFISSMLFGLTTHQTYRYFRLYRREDGKWLKCFVTTLWTLDILHVAACIYGSYFYTILCHTDILALDVMGWSEATVNIITMLVELMASGFYIRRLYILRKNSTMLIGALVVLLTIHFGIVFASCTEAIILTNYSKLYKISWLLTLGFSLNVVLDIAITGSLVWHLRKSRTGVGRTDSMLNLLVWYTVQTGALTTFSSTICMILIVAMPVNLVWVGAVMVHSKLYINSMLAVLNSRVYVRKLGMESELGTLGLASQALRYRRDDTVTFTSSGI